MVKLASTLGDPRLERALLSLLEIEGITRTNLFNCLERYSQLVEEAVKLFVELAELAYSEKDAICVGHRYNFELATTLIFSQPNRSRRIFISMLCRNHLLQIRNLDLRRLTFGGVQTFIKKHTDDIRSVMDGELVLVACKN